MKARPNYLRFDTVTFYMTPAGHRKQFQCLVDAPDADLACDIAERLLRHDKRRTIARVDYCEAIQR